MSDTGSTPPLGAMGPSGMGVASSGANPPGGSATPAATGGAGGGSAASGSTGAGSAGASGSGARGGGSSAQSDPGENSVQKVRAWTGLLVVVFGDVAIAVAAIIAVAHLSGSGNHGSLVVSIASSAFTAVGTMTTAYFGIRSMSNTAQSSITNSNTPPNNPPTGQ